MQDKQIKCVFVGCDEDFIHSVKDQEFYAEKGYVDPKYCKFHREIRKADKLRKEKELKDKIPLDNYDFNKS